jgi:hypothetical protein
VIVRGLVRKSTDDVGARINAVCLKGTGGGGWSDGGSDLERIVCFGHKEDEWLLEYARKMDVPQRIQRQWSRRNLRETSKYL